MPLTDVLANFAVFNGVASSTLSALIPDITLESFTRGDAIFEHGDESSDVFLVLRGALDALIISNDGREVLIETLRKGALFGEAESFDGGVRSMTVLARTEGTLGRIEGAIFRAWMEVHPGMAPAMLKLFAARDRTKNRRVFSFVVHDVEARVRLRIADLARESGELIDGAHLHDAPSHGSIAAHVGANREAVSRVISRLNQAGILSSGRRRIRINDVGRLLEGL